MKFEDPNNLINPETQSAETMNQETDKIEKAENAIEKEGDIEKMVIEGVEKELEELEDVKKEKEGKMSSLKKAIKRGIIGVSIVLASTIATEAMAGGLSNFDKNKVKSHGDDMFKELAVEAEKMEDRIPFGELLQEKKVQQTKETKQEGYEWQKKKTLTPERPYNIDDLFNEEEGGFGSEKSEGEKIETEKDNTESNKIFSPEELSQKEGQIEFLQSLTFEIKKLADDYYDKYGDRDNYNAFEAKIMDITDSNTAKIQKLMDGEDVKLNIKGNMSPADFAKNIVKNAEAQTNLTTQQEREGSLFNDLENERNKF